MEFEQFMNTVQADANTMIRSCKDCNRWLKKEWKGDTCSKCQFKNKYKAKVLNNIKYKFKGADKNPFDTSDFNQYTPEMRLKIAKLVGVYTEDNNDELLIKRLESFAKLHTHSHRQCPSQDS